MKKWILFFILVILFPPLVYASNNLDDVNQKICARFESDVLRLAAIADEVRDRKGIVETRVAFGGIDDQIKSADYWITYTAEAIAFQKAQKFSSKLKLRNSLETLKVKILKAKIEIGKAVE